MNKRKTIILVLSGITLTFFLCLGMEAEHYMHPKTANRVFYEVSYKPFKPWHFCLEPDYAMRLLVIRCDPKGNCAGDPWLEHHRGLYVGFVSIYASYREYSPDPLPGKIKPFREPLPEKQDHTNLLQ